MDRVHKVPVPERFLSLVYRALAEAYEDEGNTEARGRGVSDVPPSEGDAEEWTKEEVERLYCEGSPALRDLLGYLADRPDIPVKTSELASELHPNLDGEDAHNKIYGTFGHLGRLSKAFGKSHWFFTPERERNADGSPGYFVYCMPSEKAAWLKKARGRG